VENTISQAMAIQNRPDEGGIAVPVAAARAVNTVAEVAQWIANARSGGVFTRALRSRIVEAIRLNMPTSGTR